LEWVQFKNLNEEQLEGKSGEIFSWRQK